MRNDITWLGSRTILYKGRVCELDSCEDGWAAVRAMERVDAEEQRERERLARQKAAQNAVLHQMVKDAVKEVLAEMKEVKDE